MLWTLISTSQNMQLHGFIIEHPSVLMLRSEDGRGAIWWAWEYKNAEALAILAVNGVDLHYSQTDEAGTKPFELCDSYDETLKEAQSLIELKKIEKERIKEQIEEEKRKMFLAEQNEDDEDDYDDVCVCTVPLWQQSDCSHVLCTNYRMMMWKKTTTSSLDPRTTTMLSPLNRHPCTAIMVSAFFYLINRRVLRSGKNWQTRIKIRSIADFRESVFLRRRVQK